jgi:hypothetical protein
MTSMHDGFRIIDDPDRDHLVIREDFHGRTFGQFLAEVEKHRARAFPDDTKDILDDDDCRARVRYRVDEGDQLRDLPVRRMSRQPFDCVPRAQVWRIRSLNDRSWRKADMRPAPSSRSRALGRG